MKRLVRRAALMTLAAACLAISLLQSLWYDSDIDEPFPFDDD